jgi:uroporphyrin-III C-methyltransferase
MSLLAYHALQNCDVIVYDALVDKRILSAARAGAELIYAGKRGGKPSPRQADITIRLIELAGAGKRVLRLKGGDPFIFGRGAEEALALAARGIRFRIVPGISAGVGGLAYAGIPVTHRDTNHAVVFLTGHDESGDVPAAVDWQAVANAAPVLVMYMAVKHLRTIAERLIAAGRASTDRVAVVCNAALPAQYVVEGTLGGVDSIESAIAPPAIVVIGEASARRTDLDWYVGALRENALG